MNDKATLYCEDCKYFRLGHTTPLCDHREQIITYTAFEGSLVFKPKPQYMSEDARKARIQDRKFGGAAGSWTDIRLCE